MTKQIWLSKGQPYLILRGISMRVIAGVAKHLQLKTIDGMDTRPTTDRIKETLFNMLQNDIPGCSFLDLFSGSGAIAIEAISRGAESAYLVENSNAALACIYDNLNFTKLSDKATVIRDDVVVALDRLEREGLQFDIIFMDPPYNKMLEKEVLEKLSMSAIIHMDSLIIVESSLKTDFSYVSEMGFEVFKEKKYKTNKHTFLCKKEG